MFFYHLGRQGKFSVAIIIEVHELQHLVWTFCWIGKSIPGWIFIISFINAQDKKDKKWDVSNPEGPFKEVSFTTNEGTWMNVDISPDGKEIVFDLLGDIYIL